jgi:ribosome-associated translation inhibitor RaiA
VEKEDLYAAIDEVKDEIVREVTGGKKKRETLIRKGGAKIKSIIKKLTG